MSPNVCVHNTQATIFIPRTRWSTILFSGGQLDSTQPGAFFAALGWCILWPWDPGMVHTVAVGPVEIFLILVVVALVVYVVWRLLIRPRSRR